jgi:hypothetical protein
MCTLTSESHAGRKRSQPSPWPVQWYIFPDEDIRYVICSDRSAQIPAMSGRRPVVKGGFEAVVNVSSAVMSTAC